MRSVDARHAMIGETGLGNRAVDLRPPDVRGVLRQQPFATGNDVGRRGVGEAAAQRRPLIAILIFCFCCSAQWSGLFIGSIQLSDLVLILLLAALAPGAVLRQRALLGRRHRRGEQLVVLGAASSISPIGPAVFAICIAVSQVLYQFFPVSTGYLDSRLLFGPATGTYVGGSTASTLGLGSAIIFLRLVLSLAAGWIVANYAAARGLVSWNRLVAVPWVLGSALSGTVAVLQSAGLVNVSGLVSQATGERASGLAFHPNSLALYLASSIPFLAQLLESRTRVLLGVVCAVAIWGGLLAADSRIALIVAAVQTLALPIYARRTSRAAVAALVAVLLCTPLIPYLVSYATDHTRLSSTGGAASDLGRSQSYRQALLDFAHSPIFGVGAQNGGGVPSVPLGELAGGGLIAGFGYAFLWIWSIRRAAGALAVTQVRACIGAGVGIFVCSWFQNNVSDREEYLIIFSAVCLAFAARAHQDRSADALGNRGGMWPSR